MFLPFLSDQKILAQIPSKLPERFVLIYYFFSFSIVFVFFFKALFYLLTGETTEATIALMLSYIILGIHVCAIISIPTLHLVKYWCWLLCKYVCIGAREMYRNGNAINAYIWQLLQQKIINTNHLRVHTCVLD